MTFGARQGVFDSIENPQINATQSWSVHYDDDSATLLAGRLTGAAVDGVFDVPGELLIDGTFTWTDALIKLGGGDLVIDISDVTGVGPGAMLAIADGTVRLDGRGRAEAVGPPVRRPRPRHRRVVARRHDGLLRRRRPRARRRRPARRGRRAPAGGGAGGGRPSRPYDAASFPPPAKPPQPLARTGVHTSARVCISAFWAGWGRRMGHRWLWLLVLALPARVTFAQGYAPDEAAKRMTVADGLEVSLVASEPLVRQPVCIEFDDRGRLWVMQYLQYPNPAGLEPGERRPLFADDVRQGPPAAAARGEGRGPDHDPRRHRRRRRAGQGEGLRLGLEPRQRPGVRPRRGVRAQRALPAVLPGQEPRRRAGRRPGSAPHRLRHRGRPLRRQLAHLGARRLALRLPGLHRHRQHPRRRVPARRVAVSPDHEAVRALLRGRRQLLGPRLRPPTATCSTTPTTAATSCCTACRARTTGSCSASTARLHNPYAYGYIDHVPHANFTGGHVSVGGVLYEGDNLPAKFRGKFIAPDLLDHSVHWHDVAPLGSSFRSAHGGDLLRANDTWFASSDMTMGPDGALYVADWHDQRTAHPDPDAEWDRSNGRIYRIGAKGRKFEAGPDYSKLSTDELIALLPRTDNWVSRKARRELANRRDPRRSRSLWRRSSAGTRTINSRSKRCGRCTSAAGSTTASSPSSACKHENPDVRRWTVRLLGDAEARGGQIATKLAELAGSRDGRHRPQPAREHGQATPAGAGLPIVEQLAPPRPRREGPAHPAAAVVGGRAARGADARAGVGVLHVGGRLEDAARPRARSSGRLTRRYAAEGTTDGLRRVRTAARIAPSSADVLRLLLASLDQGLSRAAGRGRGARGCRAGLAGGAASSPLWSDDTTDPRSVRVLARLGATARRAAGVGGRGRPETPGGVRVAMIENPRRVRRAERLPESLLGILGTTPRNPRRSGWPPLDRPSAVRRRRASPRRCSRAIDVAPRAVRPRAIDLLLGRADVGGAAARRGRRGHGPADRRHASTNSARSPLHNDKALDERVAKRWGKVTGGTPEEKLAEVRRLNNDLRAASRRPGRGPRAVQEHLRGVPQAVRRRRRRRARPDARQPDRPRLPARQHRRPQRRRPRRAPQLPRPDHRRPRALRADGRADAGGGDAARRQGRARDGRAREGADDQGVAGVADAGGAAVGDEAAAVAGLVQLPSEQREVK